uniref:DUF4219 domain-containing protein n=1 Tax=Nelumbo nucifera TaxID=4432 RepID=A0A822XWH6_NELNU|nr:TPA_asm: hypothetical protein HUJ06_024588 [Nelumbo nucifera]
MAGLASILAGMEKLNHYNYDSWHTCMESYLQGEDLLEVTIGGETNNSIDENAKKKWKIKASKALYAIKITVENEFLEHIKKAQTPSEACDILSKFFSKTNEARL